MKPTIAGIEIAVLDETERYIQINDKNESELRNLWPHIAPNYPGFEVTFCFRNCEVPMGFVNEIGARLLDDCIEMRVPSVEIALPPLPLLTQVTEENFDTFAAYHDVKILPDFYWTSKRIKQKLGNWCIFMSQVGGQINGYIMATMRPWEAEIYCIDTPDIATGKTLASAIIAEAFKAGIPEILYMVDYDSREKEIALELGFSIKGYYKGYTIVLPDIT